MAAIYLLTPKYRLGKPDRLIERVHRWRTVLMFVFAVGTLVPYVGAADPGVWLWALFGEDLIISSAALGPIFIVASIVLVVVTPGRWRLDTVRLLLRPISLGVVPVIGLWIALRSFDTPAMRQWIQHPTGWVLLFGVVYLWLGVFVVTAIYVCARHLFNAVDGNLLLPPIVAALFSWWLIAQRLIWQSHDRPVWLDVLAAICGAAIMTALSAWEIRRFAQRGITLATGPYPPLPVPPPPYPVH